MIINKTETEERRFLEWVRETLQSAMERMEAGVREKARDLLESKKYLYEHKDAMDRMERLAVKKLINQGALSGEAAVAHKGRLEKLIASPYFGRFDFREKGVDGEEPGKVLTGRLTDDGGPLPFYLGIHAFYDEATNTNLIHDWRAPIASMYYDFEPGEVWYDAPSGRIEGEMLLKRQYRIRGGRMEFMLENSSNTMDEILQEELRKSADDRMKTIVATIQRDQNAVVRNESSRVLVIQGVAGSGKTSIALHRIAFLLYRFRESLQSRDILIISPNKVFADYISNVLPELGEDRIPEIGMEELADRALEGKLKFQTFFEQVDLLLEKSDESFRERMRYKSSQELLARMDEYLTHVEKTYFEPADLWVRRYPVPEWFIREKFEAYHRLPLLKRFAEIARNIEENVKFYYGYDMNAEERQDVRKKVTAMFRITNLRELYRDFYDWLGHPELFRLTARGRFEYADVFPFLYMKIRLEGVKTYHQVQHLLIDEMQDYTPVQYAVIARLFHCRMTILGDASQSVNPYSSSSQDLIRRLFPGSDGVKLLRSYRSSFEITRFAQRILPNEELIAIERRGEEPAVVAYHSEADELAALKQVVLDFEASPDRSMGIICKSRKQAADLMARLEGLGPYIHLLTLQSASFGGGIMLTTVHMAKGLEFDRVVVPFVTAGNYHTGMDKHLLYIACTRAMHRLTLTYSGAGSPFIPDGI